MRQSDWQLRIPQLLGDARVHLHLTQAQLGEALGSSGRTGHRWSVRRARPSNSQLETLARMVYPVDATTAEGLAWAAGTTLEELGLVTKPVPQAEVALSPPGPPLPPPEKVADSVVCAAAEAMDVAPRMIRGALLAAFTRARELGLSIETVERALAPGAPRTEVRGSEIREEAPVEARRSGLPLAVLCEPKTESPPPAGF
jgi:hypothetical protein